MRRSASDFLGGNSGIDSQPGSGKNAVDKPARPRFVTSELGAKQPETPPLLVFNPVIIADGGDSSAGARFGPPFLGDAFGPIGAGNSVSPPPPGKLGWRIVRNEPDRLDRLRRPEQPHRTRWFARGLA